MNKPYPVGTRIRYVGYCQKCNGEIGKIIKVGKYSCRIVLPQSKCSSFRTKGNIEAGWNDVELIAKKNQQLEFDFMEEDLTFG